MGEKILKTIQIIAVILAIVSFSAYSLILMYKNNLFELFYMTGGIFFFIATIEHLLSWIQKEE